MTPEAWTFWIDSDSTREETMARCLRAAEGADAFAAELRRTAAERRASQ